MSRSSRLALRTFVSFGVRYSWRARLASMFLRSPLGVPMVRLGYAGSYVDLHKSTGSTLEHRRVFAMLETILLESVSPILPEGAVIPGQLTYLMHASPRGGNIYVSSPDDDLVFVKYIGHEHLASMLAREHENLRFLRETLSGELAGSVPRFSVLAEVDGAHFLVIGYVKGKRMSEILTPGSPERAHVTEDEIVKAIGWLAKFQEQTTTGRASVASYRNEFDKLVGWYREISTQSGPAEKLFGDIGEVFSRSGDVDVRLVGCHGDFFPGNILVEGGKVIVVDWETMSKGELQTEDLFSFFLSYRVADRYHRGAFDTLESFRFVFMEGNWFSQMVAQCLMRYGAESGLSGHGVLEALFVLSLMRRSMLEAEGVLKHKMMLGQHWQKLLECYAADRDRSILKGL